MDNTVDGVLAHSFSSTGYQYIKVNGVEVGEMAIDAALAGDHGVPCIFVASDDKGAAEAKRFMPWVETVATKQGLGWNMAISKHPARAVEGNLCRRPPRRRESQAHEAVHIWRADRRWKSG